MSQASYKLHVGDCLEVLRTLPDSSVHCCVTSPPYYGLRDYGTASWEGGDPACDHAPQSGIQGTTGQRADRTFTGAKPQKQTCKRCGAERVDQQIGLEETPAEFIARLVDVFREVRRVLRDDGTCWVNMGDSYNGYMANQRGTGLESKRQSARKYIEPGAGLRTKTLKSKDLLGIPWMLAFALRDDGWYLRQDIIWHKPAPMPESVRDRCTKAHEYIFLLSKSARYFYDQQAIAEESGEFKPAGVNALRGQTEIRPRGNLATMGEQSYHPWGRNARSVWSIATSPYPDAHFATFPEALPERCIKAGTSEKGCCPSCGSPWVRVTEREARKRERPNDYVKRNGEAGTGNSCANTVAGVTVKTLGWEPSCNCDAGDPVPCTVLEPFAGSGTTLAVALKLGRSAVGIELNPEYVKLAERRIGRALAPTTFRDESKDTPAPLFGGAAAGG